MPRPARSTIAVGCVLLGLAAPVVPRLVRAVRLPEGGEMLESWLDRLSHQAANDPFRLVLEWGMVVGPSLVLAALALAFLPPGLDPIARQRRLVGFVTAAVGATLFGFYFCRPAAGMGFDFYLGEMIYAFLALPAMALLYVAGWLGTRLARPSR